MLASSAFLRQGIGTFGKSPLILGKLGFESHPRSLRLERLLLGNLGTFPIVFQTLIGSGRGFECGEQCGGRTLINPFRRSEVKGFNHFTRLINHFTTGTLKGFNHFRPTLINRFNRDQPLQANRFNRFTVNFPTRAMTAVESIGRQFPADDHPSHRGRGHAQAISCLNDGESHRRILGAAPAGPVRESEKLKPERSCKCRSVTKNVQTRHCPEPVEAANRSKPG